MERVTNLGHVAHENEPVGFLNNNITQKQFSEETAREIDVAEKALLARWAQKLLEKETLVEAELEQLRASLKASISAAAA